MSETEWDRLNAVTIGVSQQESQDNYTKWASKYSEDCELLGYTGPRKLANLVADHFPETLRGAVHILDVGAGTGLVAAELRKLKFRCIDALDPSEPMLAEPKALDLYQNYFVEYLTENPTKIPTNMYDVITGCGIYGESAHVPCEALYEMIRLVKSGGFIFLVTRHELIQHHVVYTQLEPLMDRLETEGKWKRISREVFPTYIYKKDGIMWCYQVLK